MGRLLNTLAAIMLLFSGSVRAEQPESLNQELPFVTIDLSGTAAQVFNLFGNGLAVAGLLVVLMLVPAYWWLGRARTGETENAGDVAARSVLLAWTGVMVLLMVGLAVVGVRVGIWAVLP